MYTCIYIYIYIEREREREICPETPASEIKRHHSMFNIEQRLPINMFGTFVVQSETNPRLRSRGANARQLAGHSRHSLLQY